jgi:hypothetical protein
VISNDDENGGITYEPARVLATLRLYDPQDDIEIVLLACAYLEKVRLNVDKKNNYHPIICIDIYLKDLLVDVIYGLI